MKNIMFIRFIVLLLCISDHLHSQPVNDLIRENLKGNVRSVIVSSYLISKNYNSNNKKDEFLKRIFKYDEKGNLIELGTFKLNIKQNQKFIFSYDEKGYRLDGKLFYTDSILKSTFTFTYDEVGNRTLQYHYNTRDSLQTKTVFRYNKKGLPIEINLFTPNGGLTLKQTFTYDDNNNIIQSAEYESDGSLIGKSHYTYDGYDKAGNWLKQTADKINSGNKVEITVREIQYY